MSEQATASEIAADQWFVALDVDGTIMHEDGTIDDLVADAVAAAADRGHLVTLATGRSWATTRPVLEQLGLTPEYVVCANGAITMRRDDTAEGGYSREHVETFDPTAVLERIRAFLPSGKFMVELPDGYRLYTAGMTEWNLENAREVVFDELLDQRATRVVVTSLEHGLDEFFEIVDQMGLHHVSYAIGWTAWLDIAPDGVNKATALERVRGWLGARADRVLAVGDGRNDLEMFAWAGAAGRAVAMGQAPDEVRAAAGEVTGAVEEAGLASILDTLP
ncbi:HAD family hydrolase [Agromyces sp. H3Y2-19a]|jgi:HAD superfamily hydrolase (TIGR01484 family)|uniref:HAD family hydrolase n=1 Tax=Agromyces TaxID=33877 RepID=UPI001E407BB3|nr:MULTISPECIES: HAD family hydrolase [Agromyces]MCD5345085.1 Cof-type HAD-IIB family hydrolase [Agromyces sp. S2-1-8]MDF0513757.1 HAD family hydrolase [Agromyces chromiiresistens]